jgi:hypothetical protein
VDKDRKEGTAPAGMHPEIDYFAIIDFRHAQPCMPAGAKRRLPRKTIKKIACF